MTKIEISRGWVNPPPIWWVSSVGSIDESELSGSWFKSFLHQSVFCHWTAPCEPQLQGFHLLFVSLLSPNLVTIMYGHSPQPTGNCSCYYTVKAWKYDSSVVLYSSPSLYSEVSLNTIPPFSLFWIKLLHLCLIFSLATCLIQYWPAKQEVSLTVILPLRK